MTTLSYWTPRRRTPPPLPPVLDPTSVAGFQAARAVWALITRRQSIDARGISQALGLPLPLRDAALGYLLSCGYIDLHNDHYTPLLPCGTATEAPR